MVIESNEDRSSERAIGVRALFVAALIGMIGVGGVVALAVWAPWRSAAGFVATRSNEEDLALLRDSRARALREVWRALEAFRAERGEWPEDLDALAAFDPVVEDALAPPALSRDGAYVIDFAALHAPADGGPARVIVDDPGYRLPGAADAEERLEAFRVVLLSTGEAAGRTEARRRGARFGE